MGDKPTDDNSNLVDMDDLNEFEDEFFGRKTETPDEAVGDEDEDEEIAENEDDSLATDEDTDAPAEETEDEDSDEEDSAPEKDEEPKPKKNRKSLQTRIDELTAKAREAERERDLERRERELLRQRLETIESGTRKPEVKEEAPIRDRLPADAPNPDATDEKGEAVYPLGEFDPRFITDLTRFTIETERKAMQEREAAETHAKQIAAAQDALRNQWVEKLEKAEEEAPEIRSNIRHLTETFTDIDPNYGDYLAATIMSCDNGPDILNYLSQNIGEAQKIVASGPAAATLAIGRLEAKFSKSVGDSTSNKRVSDAPKPPVTHTRGSGARTRTAPDTDDLDAFEREFFKKPGRR
jgi:hypothetical protein